MVFQCSHCNVKFDAYPSRFVNKKNCFCSKKCEGTFRQEQCITKIHCSCVFCGKNLKIKQSSFKRRNSKFGITCSIFCASQIKKQKYLATNNPNNKYVFDTHYFDCIDKDEKAYLLGWLASDGSIRPGAITLAIHKKDEAILNVLRNEICPQIPIRLKVNTNLKYFSINSTEMVQSVCKHLAIEPKSKFLSVQLPACDIDMQWAFLRGLFDGEGHVRNIKAKYLSCCIASQSMPMKHSIKDICAKYFISSHISSGAITFSGLSAMKFLTLIYDNSSIHLKRKYDTYIEWKKRAEGRTKKAA